MRIGVDVRKLDDGGIGTYIRETLAALRRVSPDLEIVAFGKPGARGRLPVERVEWVDTSARTYSLVEHLTLSRSAARAEIDLFHAPHYILPIGLRVPSVVTVHDLIHILVPRSPLHPIYARWMIRSACRRAGRVIAVSETTGRDLIRRLGVPESKIRIIPNAVDERFRRPSEVIIAARLAALGIERPYVLFVGNALPHKNVPTLVRAWHGLPEPRPALVLCGEGHDQKKIRGMVGGRSSAQIHFIGGLGVEDLAAVYAGGVCLASASLYEGFWLPALEAMACETPVLGPDTGAVPEVTGNAALHVSPERVDLLTDGLYRLLNDPELRARLVEQGKQRLSDFSWEASARKTLLAYNEVVSEKR
jgi:glycosyltransferase involved in cell wall biosynthesis